MPDWHKSKLSYMPGWHRLQLTSLQGVAALGEGPCSHSPHVGAGGWDKNFALLEHTVLRGH